MPPGPDQRVRPLAQRLIRWMEPADETAVAHLWHDVWHASHGWMVPHWISAMRSLDTFVGRLRSASGPCLVVEGLGQTSDWGASGDGLNDWNRSRAIDGFGIVYGSEIDQLYVSQSAQGQGVGASLLNRLEGVLWANGVLDASLQCAEGNDRARAFYVRNGWFLMDVRLMPIWMPPGETFLHPTCLYTKRLVGAS